MRAGPSAIKIGEAENVVSPCVTVADCYVGAVIPPADGKRLNVPIPPAAAHEAHHDLTSD